MPSKCIDVCNIAVDGLEPKIGIKFPVKWIIYSSCCHHKLLQNTNCLYLYIIGIFLVQVKGWAEIEYTLRREEHGSSFCALEASEKENSESDMLKLICSLFFSVAYIGYLMHAIIQSNDTLRLQQATHYYFHAMRSYMGVLPVRTCKCKHSS